ncbi:MAG: GNAT family N-acetyltransferase [Anaerolineales bacterium]|nr:GNAT family N-acetyltransferase [Anaerolineales bacterium]
MTTTGSSQDQIRFRSYDKTDEQVLINLLNMIWKGDVGAISYYTPTEWVDNANSFHRSIVAELVNETEKKVVGFGNISHYPTHPTHAFLNLNIHPNYQQQGLGKKLYHHLISLLKTYHPYPCLSATYENQIRAVSFLKSHGFKELIRTYLPRLRVDQVDINKLKDITLQITAYGYQIYSMADLATDPERNQKLADLLFDIYAAIHPHNPPGNAMYEKRQEIFLSNLLPEATFIAIYEGEYAATGSLLNSQRREALDIGLFGVRKNHQIHALELALAIKWYEITFAHQAQIKHLVAEIDSTDSIGMAVLNALPFHPSSTWITFVKEL